MVQTGLEFSVKYQDSTCVMLKEPSLLSFLCPLGVLEIEPSFLWQVSTSPLATPAALEHRTLPVTHKEASLVDLGAGWWGSTPSVPLDMSG